MLQQLVDSRCVTVQQDLQEEAAQLTQMNVLHIHVITMGRVLIRYLKSRILYCLSCCKPIPGISDLYLYQKMRVIQWLIISKLYYMGERSSSSPGLVIVWVLGQDTYMYLLQCLSLFRNRYG